LCEIQSLIVAVWFFPLVAQWGVGSESDVFSIADVEWIFPWRAWLGLGIEALFKKVVHVHLSFLGDSFWDLRKKTMYPT
jgi:hypothetical protein